jgi:2-iminobutanoate/2-iminopropanoate deaminase
MRYGLQRVWDMTIRKIVLSICIGALVAGCEHEHKDSVDVEFIAAPGTEDMNLPFSPAVRVGNTIYLSGNLGNIPGTFELAPGGIEGETRQTMENIKTAVELAGSSMDRIVKCSLFIADISEWGAVNEVYRTYFDVPPARSAFGANGLALGARIEIDCIAVTK